MTQNKQKGLPSLEEWREFLGLPVPDESSLDEFEFLRNWEWGDNVDQASAIAGAAIMLREVLNKAMLEITCSVRDGKLYPELLLFDTAYIKGDRDLSTLILERVHDVDVEDVTEGMHKGLSLIVEAIEGKIIRDKYDPGEWPYRDELIAKRAATEGLKNE